MLAKLFPQNEHTLDRTLRVLLGLALLTVAFTGPQSPWGFVGFLPLVTGLVGSCPLYTLLGISSCPVKSS